MPAPSLRIPISVDLEKFKEQMKQTSTLTSSAAKQITKQFLDMNSAITDTVVGGAARMALGVAGKVALVVGSFKLMSAAIDGARQQLQDMVALADKAQNAGVSPAFLQAFTSEARKLRVEAGELEAALDHAFSATKERSPIDIGEWSVGEDKITAVEKELRVLNATMEKGQRLDGLVLFRDAKTQEDRIQAVLKAMIQLQSIGQQAAAYDLGEKMFGPQLIDRMRQGKVSADGMVASIKAAAANSDGIFSNDLVNRAKEMDQQLQLAHQRLSQALKPSWDDLASVLLTIKGHWADTVDLIAKAVEWSNKLGLTSETARKRNELAAVNDAIKNGTALGGLPQVTSIPGVGKLYDVIGAEKPQDALRRRRDQLQGEIDASERGAPEGPEAPTKSRGTGPAPTKISTGGSDRDRFDTSADAIDKRTAALQAEAATLDQSTAARERAKIAAQLMEVAQQANAAAGLGEKVVTEEQRKRIEEVTTAYAAATQAIEKTTVALSIKRGRETALLDPSDVAIANELKGLYPDVATALSSVEASAMRTNEAMRGIGNTMSSSLTTGLADILDGTKSVSAGFADMSKAIVRALEEAMIKALVGRAHHALAKRRVRPGWNFAA
ncbi:hypothetical protein ACVWXM_008039 [Bradyrhizobium sp. GM7.3]